MSTFSHILFNSLEDRWKEVYTLLNNADEQLDNEDLYNAICRSTTVLIVAHFEGFITETVKAILSDINMFSSYTFTPYSMKKTFCNQFIDVYDPSNDKKVKNLVCTFERLDTKFDFEPFLFENHKNPSSNMIDKICKKFGISDFFAVVEDSVIDQIFENNKTENEELLQQLKEHLLTGVESYPYRIDPSLFNFDMSFRKKSKKDGLWKTFLDEVLKKRHSIAHGTDLTNSLSSNEILDFKFKIDILQYSLGIILCYQVVKGR